MKRFLIVLPVFAVVLLVGVAPGATAPRAGASPIAAARQALAELDALPPTPNTAWGLTPTADQLVLTVSRFAPAAGAARELALADAFGPIVRVVRTDRPITEQYLVAAPPPVVRLGAPLGGDRISDGQIICSAGFNLVRSGQDELSTAGHCTAGLPAWDNIGPSLVSVYPNADYGLIRDDAGPAPGVIDLYDGTAQPIIAVGAATVNEHVCASGQSTQVTCGTVTGIDRTVDYGNGNVVHGLIETSVHTADGDSGGPLFDGSTGLGTVSGGDGVTDYFQPLAPVLAAEHLVLAPIA